MLLVESSQARPSGELHYVVNGGALLQHVPWSKGQTYDAILNTYSEYVVNKYGEAVVVFDGYMDHPQKMLHTRGGQQEVLESL